jgi:hypothetical protein
MKYAGDCGALSFIVFSRMPSYRALSTSFHDSRQAQLRTDIMLLCGERAKLLH